MEDRAGEFNLFQCAQVRIDIRIEISESFPYQQFKVYGYKTI